MKQNMETSRWKVFDIWLPDETITSQHFPEGSQHQPTSAIHVIQSKQGGHRLATLGVRDTLLVAWFSTCKRVMKMVIEVLMEMVNNYQDELEEREISASLTTNLKIYEMK